jgi:hypothetical protein
MTTSKPVTTGARCCRKCAHPMVGQRHTPPPGWKRHCARGLCTSCWRTARRTGELLDFERGSHARDEVLDEWALLRKQGASRAQAAKRIGMSAEALDRAYLRARRAGDPRALPALTGQRNDAA